MAEKALSRIDGGSPQVSFAIMPNGYVFQPALLVNVDCAAKSIDHPCLGLTCL